MEWAGGRSRLPGACCSKDSLKEQAGEGVTGNTGPFFYLGDLRGGGNRDKAGVRGLVGPQ